LARLARTRRPGVPAAELVAARHLEFPTRAVARALSQHQTRGQLGSAPGALGVDQARELHGTNSMVAPPVLRPARQVGRLL